MKSKTINRVKMARVYTDEDVVFIFDGMIWVPMKQKDIENVVIPEIVVNGKHVFRNTTIKEALDAIKQL